MQTDLSIWKNWRYDLPAAIVVTLVALPLCLGIALASGAPLFSGIIAGIVGGIVIGTLSKSSLSVSGPAAGLTVIVLAAIQQLPTFEAFLLAVVLAGALQVLLGIARAGVVGDFIPSSVIKGMLAAIGIILILKQIQHAVGYDVNRSGHFSFWDNDGHNTFSGLWYMLDQTLSMGAVVISSISLAFLFWWDKRQAKLQSFLRFLPGPLVVVLFGIIANEVFKAYVPSLAIDKTHLVDVPVATSVGDFMNQFSLPDFNAFMNVDVWVIAITLAAVASIETLLSVEAVDKLDPYKRVTPTNRELVAQGVGNMASGLIGGLPVTSVIVRSSANVSAGGRTKLSAIMHSLFLLAMVAAIPAYLNYIPLSALAAILIATGYKLTKPGLFIQKYQMGIAYLIPFLVTIMAILVTDLLVGVLIGIAVGLGFILWETFRGAITVVQDENNYLVRFKKDLFFFHKPMLRKLLAELPDNCNVLLDLDRINSIHMDLTEVINDFIENAPHRDIKITIKPQSNVNIANLKEPNNAAL